MLDVSEEAGDPPYGLFALEFGLEFHPTRNWAIGINYMAFTNLTFSKYSTVGASLLRGYLSFYF